MGGGREPRGACTLVGSDPLRSCSTWWGGLSSRAQAVCSFGGLGGVCVCVRAILTHLDREKKKSFLPWLSYHGTSSYVLSTLLCGGRRLAARRRSARRPAGRRRLGASHVSARGCGGRDATQRAERGCVGHKRERARTSSRAGGPGRSDALKLETPSRVSCVAGPPHTCAAKRDPARARVRGEPVSSSPQARAPHLAVRRLCARKVAGSGHRAAAGRRMLPSRSSCRPSGSTCSRHARGRSFGGRVGRGAAGAGAARRGERGAQGAAAAAAAAGRPRAP